MRYTVDRPTGGHRGASTGALTPAMNRPAGRFLWWGASGVEVNTAVSAPKPGVAPYGDHGGGRGQDSRNALDVVLPYRYYVVPNDLMRPPVRVHSNTPMPVPAGNLYNMPGISMRSRRTGGANQVSQPGVSQRWPDLYGRGGAGGVAPTFLRRLGNPLRSS